jgi:hypothetical protein
MRHFLFAVVAALALLLPASLAAATRVYVVSRPVVRVNAYGPGYGYGYRVVRPHGYGYRVVRPRRAYLRNARRYHRRHHRGFHRQRFGPVIVVPRLY